MATDNVARDEHALFMVKGMLTKFMRMLFPLEFRIDSLPESGAILPFHYPLLYGGMIYLPERINGIGGADAARVSAAVRRKLLAGVRAQGRG